MKKWILFILPYCCFSTALEAQEIIRYETAVKQKGDTIEIKLVFDISPGMHVYAPSLSNEAQGFYSMKLQIDSLPAGLKDLKHIVWSEPVMVAGGEVFKDEGHSVVFRLKGKPKPGASLKGALHFQACNEEMCFPPQEQAFSIHLSEQKKNKK